MAATRRALRALTMVFNDEKVKALVCFVCGQIHTTVGSSVPEDCKDESSSGSHGAIRYFGLAFLRWLESTCPGTLLNNCSYELWQKRYQESEDCNSKYTRNLLAWSLGRHIRRCRQVPATLSPTGVLPYPCKPNMRIHARSRHPFRTRTMSYSSE